MKEYQPKERWRMEYWRNEHWRKDDGNEERSWKEYRWGEYQARNMHQRGSQTQIWGSAGYWRCISWMQPLVSMQWSHWSYICTSELNWSNWVIKHRQGICIRKGFKHRRSPEWGSEAGWRCIRRMQPLWSLSVSRSDHSIRKQPLWYIADTPWWEVPHIEWFGRKVWSFVFMLAGIGGGLLDLFGIYGIYQIHRIYLHFIWLMGFMGFIWIMWFMYLYGSMGLMGFMEFMGFFLWFIGPI